MTEPATAQADPVRRAHHKGPSTLYILLNLTSGGLVALGIASGLRTDGFSWWRVVGIFALGITAGFWMSELGPLRRWRAKRFGAANV